MHTDTEGHPLCIWDDIFMSMGFGIIFGIMKSNSIKRRGKGYGKIIKTKSYLV